MFFVSGQYLQDETKSKKGLGEVYEVCISLLIICNCIYLLSFFPVSYSCFLIIYATKLCYEQTLSGFSPYHIWIYIAGLTLSCQHLLLCFFSLFSQEEYVQKTNLASAPLSTTDELKKEVKPNDLDSYFIIAFPFH